jgi:diguanylate cyclase (GGDEF)-like protein
MFDLPESIPFDAFAGGLLGLLQSAGALAALKDGASGRYLWANTAYAAFVGRAASEMVGKTDLELLPLADAHALRASDQLALGTPDSVATVQHRFERDHRKVDVRAMRCVLRGEGPSAQVLSLWWDESDRLVEAQQLQAALAQLERQQAAFDQLSRQQRDGLDRPTELFRSEHFEEHLQRELALSAREHREFALVLLAFDEAAALSSRYGAGGLQQIANAVGHLLRTNTRAMDVMSLLAEDRYAILLSGVGLATAHTRMEQMRRQCSTHVVVHQGLTMPFSVSVGVASFPHTADTLDSLSHAAEQALADARRRGGNRVSLATIALTPRV